MGMYDTVGSNGDQIKVFSVPCFYNCDHGKNGDVFSMGYIGGLLRNFGKGEPVPTKTLWYRYPDNFMIIDEDRYGEGYGDICHIIIDGKYYETYDKISDIPEDMMNKIDACFDYTGDRISNIHSTADIKKYAEAMRLYTSEWNNIFNESRLIMDEMREIGNQMKESPNDPELNEKFHAIQKRLDEAWRAENVKAQEIARKYLPEYIPSKSQDGMEKHDARIPLFGAYIDCLNRDMEPGKHESDYDKKNHYKENLLYEAKKIYSEISLDDYFDWLQPSQEERELVMRIIKQFLE